MKNPGAEKFTLTASASHEANQKLLKSAIISHQRFCKNNDALLSKAYEAVPQKQKKRYLQLRKQQSEKEAYIAKQYQSLGDTDNVVTWYKRSIESHNNLENKLALFLIHHQHECYTEAYALFPDPAAIDRITDPDKLKLTKDSYFFYCIRSGAAFLINEIVPRNPKRARLYLQRAFKIRENIPDTTTERAYNYYNFGVISEFIAQTFDHEQNIEKALIWRKKAMKADCTEAKYNYGVMIYDGEVEGTLDQALELFQEVAKYKKSRNRLSALNYCGMIYEGKGGEENIATAKQFFEDAYKTGDMQFGVNLAVFLYEQFADTDGKEQAIKILKNLANRNFARAHVMLGSIIWQTVADDEVETVRDQVKKHFQTAFSLDPTDGAAYNLGVVYYFGYGDRLSAIAAYIDCIHINPEHALAKHNLYALLHKWVKDLGEEIATLSPVLDEVVVLLQETLPKDDPTRHKLTRLKKSLNNFANGEMDDLLQENFPDAANKFSREIKLTKASMNAVTANNTLTDEDKVKTLLNLAVVMPHVADRAQAVKRLGELIATKARGILEFPNLTGAFYQLLDKLKDKELSIDSCVNLFSGISQCRLHPKVTRLAPLMASIVLQLTETARVEKTTWEHIIQLSLDFSSMHFINGQMEKITTWFIAQISELDTIPNASLFSGILFNFTALHAHYCAYSHEKIVLENIEQLVKMILEKSPEINFHTQSLSLNRCHKISLTYFSNKKIIGEELLSAIPENPPQNKNGEAMSVNQYVSTFTRALVGFGFVKMKAGQFMPIGLFSGITLPTVNTIIIIDTAVSHLRPSGKNKKKMRIVAHPLVHLQQAMIALHEKEHGPMNKVHISYDELNGKDVIQLNTLLLRKLQEAEVLLPVKQSQMRKVAVGAEGQQHGGAPTELPPAINDTNGSIPENI